MKKGKKVKRPKLEVVEEIPTEETETTRDEITLVTKEQEETNKLTEEKKIRKKKAPKQEISLDPTGNQKPQEEILAEEKMKEIEAQEETESQITEELEER